MLHTRQHLPLRCPIAAELIRDEHPWHILTALQELAEELLRCTLVAPALHEDIEYITFLVDRPPQLVRLLVDLEEDFIHVPLVPWSGPTAT